MPFWRERLHELYLIFAQREVALNPVHADRDGLHKIDVFVELGEEWLKVA
jgi:hypothetical protein